MEGTQDERVGLLIDIVSGEQTYQITHKDIDRHLTLWWDELAFEERTAALSSLQLLSQAVVIAIIRATEEVMGVPFKEGNPEDLAKLGEILLPALSIERTVVETPEEAGIVFYCTTESLAEPVFDSITMRKTDDGSKEVEQ